MNKTHLIFIMLFFLSIPSKAEIRNTDAWKYNGIYSKENYSHELRAMFSRSTDNLYTVSFNNFSDNRCKKRGKYIIWEGVIIVNDIDIKAISECSSFVSKLKAKTKRGREYILNEFKTKDSVKMNSLTYSAKGFTKILNDRIKSELNTKREDKAIKEQQRYNNAL